jgi:hypothetical protein
MVAKESLEMELRSLICQSGQQEKNLNEKL